MKLVLFALLAWPLLWLNGCATQADIQESQSEVGSLRRQVADMSASVNGLRRELDQARGQIEEVRHLIDRYAQQGTDTSRQIARVEERLRAAEERFGRRATAPLPSARAVEPSPYVMLTNAGLIPPPLPIEPWPPAATAPERGATSDLEIGPTEVRTAYHAGLQALHEQHYDEVIRIFRDFQRQYPTSEMADDAQYWIGESYFLQGDYNRAILEFNDVLKYRRGDRVPGALLRQAQAFLEIGDKTDARLILQKLQNDYPDSDPAREAAALLPGLGH